MKIIKLLYIKYGLSFSICLASSFVIFFIFSLISNLNEDYNFNTIINISLLNSIQILTYVPSFIFLLSIILLTIFIKSKSEIIIIKSYVKTINLIIFFLPIIFFFTLLEINKKHLAQLLENGKANLIDNNDKLSSKILIDNSDFSKTFIVFKNLELNNLEDAEYRLFEIIDKKIYSAEFSNNIIISNNTLIANSYTKYINNLIENFDIQKKINVSFIDLINQSSIVKEISEKNNFRFDTRSLNIVIFFVIFFNFIFLIFFNKRYIGIKESLLFPTIISLIILIYSFFIFNNSLNFYKNEFEILASVFIGIFFLKVFVNE